MIEQPDRKFEEVYDVSDYEIWTDTGWRDVNKVCKTVPYKVWEIRLKDGKQLKCADNHIVFINNKEVFVKDVQVGDLIDTENGPIECVEVIESNVEENMYDVQVDGERYYSNNILSHNTTIVSVYALWYVLFNADKVVGIVSNKESSAKMILGRIKRMYEVLPTWMKPGVESYAKTMVSFDNGTQLIISATSPDAFRGNTLNLLISDELGFVPPGQADEFWAANYPTISASEESKIVVISTPNGMYNLFHRIYTGGESGRNSFYTMKVSWENVPGRDKNWAEEQKKNLGKTKFAQEMSCEFLGSANTVIDPEVLKVLINQSKNPIVTDMKDKFLVYEKPKNGSFYVIGVDTAKGTGEHYSVCQILKIISMKPIRMEQVAVYIDNEVDVYRFADIINRLSYYYNNAYIMVENNSEGAAVVNRLWWDHENENLVNTGTKAVNLGIRATTKTKPKAVLLMKKLIEDGSTKLVDVETIEELTTFVDENGKYFGKEKPDDCVSALYWACYLLEMNVLDESFEFTKTEDEENGWGILTDIEVEHEYDWSWLTRLD